MSNRSFRGGLVNDPHLSDQAQLQNGDRNDSHNSYFGTVINHCTPQQSAVDLTSPLTSSVTAESANASVASSLNLAGSTLNQHFEVPHAPDDNFTGRKNELDRLESLCTSSKVNSTPSSSRTIVLQGLGGSGKTQICLKFADINRARFWGIFWIDASSRESIERGLAQIEPFQTNPKIDITVEDADATDNGLDVDFHDDWSETSDESSSQREITKKTGAHRLYRDRDAPRKSNVDRVKKQLTNLKAPWLLIFDNADDPDLDIEPYLPMGETGANLITTRNELFDLNGARNTIKVDSLDIDDSVEVFRKANNISNLEFDAKGKKNKKYHGVIKDLVGDKLGGLPLAIIQAASVMRRKGWEPSDYIAKFDKKRAELMRDNRVQAKTNHRPVYTTWEVSIDAITEKDNEESQDALELLDLFSCFDRQGIPQRLFRRAWKRVHYGIIGEDFLGKITGGKEWFWTHQPNIFRSDGEESSWEKVENRFDNAVELLRSFSLVSYNSERKRIAMHPLVHSWAYDRLDATRQDRSLTVATFMAALSMSAPYGGLADQFDLFFRDLAHNLERLANRFIERGSDQQRPFTKEQTHIIKGLYVSLVSTLQWHKARQLRRKTIYSATGRILTRLKSGPSVRQLKD